MAKLIKTDGTEQYIYPTNGQTFTSGEIGKIFSRGTGIDTLIFGDEIMFIDGASLRRLPRNVRASTKLRQNRLMLHRIRGVYKAEYDQVYLSRKGNYEQQTEPQTENLHRRI